MDWLKKNYERVALAVGILFLLAASAWIYTSVTDFPTRFADRDSKKPKDGTIKSLPIEAITSASDVVKEPRNWTPHEGSLFVSRPYVLRDGTLFDPIAGNTNLHEPIKNSWLIKYDLPYWQADIKEQDSDGDHFSNLDEFLADTNPKDDKSVPPYYGKLRLEKFISKPFRLIFTGSPDDGQTFTINTRDRGGRTQFLELNQMIKDTPYKLLSFQKKSTTKDDMEIDVSELIIENTETKQKLTLVSNKEANDPTSFGEFLYLYDNSKFTVKKDDEFVLVPQTDRKYKLIDISEREALIKDLQSGEEHKIPSVQ